MMEREEGGRECYSGERTGKVGLLGWEEGLTNGIKRGVYCIGEGRVVMEGRSCERKI